jgi:hypothetical protein
MKNKIVKTIGVLSLASLMSTSAFSQITISGYAEVGMITGSAKQTRSTAHSKGLGSEFLVTVAGKGTMSNGWTFSGYQNFDTDEVGNGVDAANVNPMTTRALEISPSKDFKLFYTYDGVYGGEIARTAIPVVTERPVDLTGLSGLSEFIDVTSGGHAVGAEALNLGPAGRFSIAYNPNLYTTQSASSDRVSSATNFLGSAGNNHLSGYSFGYSVTPGPIRVAAGYTKLDAKQNATAVDPKSKTLGVTFTQAPFAIGAQRTKNEDGRKIVGTLSFDDTVDSVSATFAATKEITLGAIYSKMEREVVGSATGPDTKVVQVVAAYNLGPVVASIAYEDAKDKVTAGNEVTAAGHDTKLTKIKVKANF